MCAIAMRWWYLWKGFTCFPIKNHHPVKSDCIYTLKEKPIPMWSQQKMRSNEQLKKQHYHFVRILARLGNTLCKAIPIVGFLLLTFFLIGSILGVFRISVWMFSYYQFDTGICYIVVSIQNSLKWIIDADCIFPCYCSNVDPGCIFLKLFPYER